MRTIEYTSQFKRDWKREQRGKYRKALQEDFYYFFFQLISPLIRPGGQLLPKGEAKNLCLFVFFSQYIFINEINTLKTLAQLGEGGPRQWWVRGFYEQKCEEIEKLEVAPHPAWQPPSPGWSRQNEMAGH